MKINGLISTFAGAGTKRLWTPKTAVRTGGRVSDRQILVVDRQVELDFSGAGLGIVIVPEAVGYLAKCAMRREAANSRGRRTARNIRIRRVRTVKTCIGR